MYGDENSPYNLRSSNRFRGKDDGRLRQGEYQGIYKMTPQGIEYGDYNNKNNRYGGKYYGEGVSDPNSHNLAHKVARDMMTNNGTYSKGKGWDNSVRGHNSYRMPSK